MPEEPHALHRTVSDATRSPVYVPIDLLPDTSRHDNLVLKTNLTK